MRALLLIFCAALVACARDGAPAPVYACSSAERAVTIDGVRQAGVATVCRERAGG